MLQWKCNDPELVAVVNTTAIGSKYYTFTGKSHTSVIPIRFLRGASLVSIVLTMLVKSSHEKIDSTDYQFYV